MSIGLSLHGEEQPFPGHGFAMSSVPLGARRPCLMAYCTDMADSSHIESVSPISDADQTQPRLKVGMAFGSAWGQG